MMRRKDGGAWRARLLALALLFASVQPGAHAQARGIITSVAGTEGCSDLKSDPAGNLYFLAEDGVRKLAVGTGKITTVSTPELQIGGGIAVNAAGDLYVAYQTLQRVQKMAAGTHAITTVAGTQDRWNGGNRRIPGPATEAFLRNPRVLAFDPAGNLYIGEFGSRNDILKITTRTGVMTGVPLNLDRVDPAFRRDYVTPTAIAFDGDGNLYISDQSPSVIWKVAPNGGDVKRVAGSGEGYSGDGMPALDAKISAEGMAFDAGGNLYLADYGNNRIRMVAKGNGIITTVAGNGTSRKQFVDGRYQKADDGDGGPATQARISGPESIAFDSSGNLYICGGILRKVAGIGNTSAVSSAAGATSSPASLQPGSIMTVAGNGTRAYGGDGGPATATGLMNPVNVAVDSAGNVYITDQNMRSVLRVAGGTGVISRFAGAGRGATVSRPGDGGPGAAAMLFNPAAALPDAAGNLYIADSGVIRKVQSGIITSVVRAQNSAQHDLGLSPEAVALISTSAFYPTGVAADAVGNLYFTDPFNACIRKFAAASRTISTVVASCEQGANGAGFAGDGGPATGAKLQGPSGIALDPAGNIYIADTGNNRIRKVTASTGIITTIAGSGARGDFGGDGAAAVKAQLNAPSGLAVDGAGNVFIADRLNHRVRKIAAKTGVITTLAGTGVAYYGGDGGSAVDAALSDPRGVAVDSAGNLYIADTGNNRVRKVAAAGSRQ